MQEYLSTWLEEYRRNGNRGRGLAENTWEVYHNAIHNYAIPFLGMLRLSEVGPHHLVALYAHMAAQGRSVRMRQIVHRTLRLAFQQAVETGQLGQNPCDRIPRNQKPIPERKPVRAMTEGQVKVFLEAAKGTPWHLPFWISFTAGLRRGELIALNCSDIEWTVNTQGQRIAILHIRRQLPRKKGQGLVESDLKTENARRDVRLPADVSRAVEAHLSALAHRSYTEWLFPNPNRSDGRPCLPETVDQAFKNLLKRAGLPDDLVLHDARHTHATLLLKRRVPLKAVARRLGHADERITLQAYAAWLEEMEEEAAEEMEGLSASH